MPVADSAAWLFGKADTPADKARRQREEEERRQKRARTTPLFRRQDDSGDTPGAPQKQQRSKRKWGEPQSAQRCWERMKATSNEQQQQQLRCCRLNCIELFANGGGGRDDDEGGASNSNNSSNSSNDNNNSLCHDGDFLEREQAIFKGFTREEDRKRFVTEHVPLAKLSQGSMIAAGTPVCNRAFREFFRVSDSLIFSCKGTEKAPASRSATRCPVERTRDSPKRDRAIGFFQHYQDMFAQLMPNSDDKYLYLKNKNELFDQYESQTRKELDGELVGLDAALCTREYFNRIWAQEFPHLQLKPTGDFMLCKICTLLKSAIFGTQSGSRGIQDEAEKDLKRKEYDDHMEDVSNDRKAIAKLKTAAENAKMNGVPWDQPYCIMDGANQSNFVVPLSKDKAHGIDDKRYGERAKVYGVLVAGMVMNVFFAPQILGTVHGTDPLLGTCPGRRDRAGGQHCRREQEQLPHGHFGSDGWSGNHENGPALLHDGWPHPHPDRPGFLLLRQSGERGRHLHARGAGGRLQTRLQKDPEKQKRVKLDHADSLRILRTTGTKAFDLDTSWLPLQVSGDDSEPDPDDGGDGGVSHTVSPTTTTTARSETLSMNVYGSINTVAVPPRGGGGG